jgi:hypothetical protein
VPVVESDFRVELDRALLLLRANDKEGEGMSFGSNKFISLMTEDALEGVKFVGEVCGLNALRSVEGYLAVLNDDLVVLIVTKLSFDPATAEEEAWGQFFVGGRSCGSFIISILQLLMLRLLALLFLGLLVEGSGLNLACDVAEEAHEVVFGLAVH